MAEPIRMKLSDERIRRITPPDTGESTVWDTEVLGLGVRCIPSGAKSYIVTYRAGRGRSGTPRRVTLGKVNAIRLEDARERALDIRAQVMRGGDPVAELRAARKEAARPALTLSEALDRYERDQERRGVVGRGNVLSALRRHLLGHVRDIPVAQVDRRAVVEAIEALEAAGLAGAATALRSHSSTFLKWCADRGFIEANPLQGYRASRATRAQRVARPGRDLSDSEIALAWAACEGADVNPAFGQLVRMLILTGQRRTETSRMRWSDLNADRTVWRIPADDTKNGIAHDVPLPPLARHVIEAAHRHAACDYVFSTTGKGPISGWSKLEPRLRAEIARLAVQEGPEAALVEPWTLHDLRRTFRSGLSRLGVEPDVAEIMLNHRPETLRAIYDRDPRMDARRDAAERWALHVGGIVDPDSRSNVIGMRGVS